VADESAARRAESSKTFNCKAYKDYRGLLGDKNVDVFINALPSHLHPKASVEALKAGQHVICEKPVAVKLSDFDRMVAAGRKAKRKLAFFQNNRFMPSFLKILDVVESGVLGRLVHCRLNRSGWSRRWDWQTRQDLWGGNLNNTGPHPLDQAIVLFGSKTPKVFCRMDSTDGSFGDADNFAAVTLYGTGSPVVEVLVSSCLAYPSGDMFSVNGTRGGLAGNATALRWKYFRGSKAPKQKLQPSWTPERKYFSENIPWIEKTWKISAKAIGPHKAFYNHFYQFATGKAKLVITPAQVRRQVAVLEECHRQNRLPRYEKKYGRKLKPVARPAR
jgi:predicted dehydrogenase